MTDTPALLLPTGTCFDDVVFYVGERVRRDPALMWGSTLIVVHGIARIPDENPTDAGRRYAHGWIEDDGIVWDAKLLNGERVYVGHDPAAYYAYMRVETTTRYTLLEAYAEESRAGHYGPWRPEYLALLREGDSTPRKLPRTLAHKRRSRRLHTLTIRAFRQAD